MPRLGWTGALVGTLLCAGTAGAQQSGDSASTRGHLEQRARQRVEAVVQERLALTDDQLRQLRSVSGQYEPRRRTLMAQEREARLVLRAQMQRGTAADQKLVSDALDTLLKVQRARLDLAESEQRELAGFLQPAQRAGYLALQDQMRRRVEEMRRSRGGGPGGRARRGPGGRPDGGMQR